EFACALALLGTKRKTVRELSDHLFKNYKIHTTSINWEAVHGVRITPNVYTTTNDLDRLVKALREFAKI
ncbi:MAG: aminotransferase, partial [Bacteroidota bacterium]